MTKLNEESIFIVALKKDFSDFYKGGKMLSTGGFSFQQDGYIFTTPGENNCKILSVKLGEKEIKLGQRVYSNGAFATPAGTMGLVVGIEFPHQWGRSSNIIRVWFEGYDMPDNMKFKELLLEKGA